MLNKSLFSTSIGFHKKQRAVVGCALTLFIRIWQVTVFYVKLNIDFAKGDRPQTTDHILLK